MIKQKNIRDIHIIETICYSNLRTLKCSNLKYGGMVITLAHWTSDHAVIMKGGGGGTHTKTNTTQVVDSSLVLDEYHHHHCQRW